MLYWYNKIKNLFFRKRERHEPLGRKNAKIQFLKWRGVRSGKFRNFEIGNFGSSHGLQVGSLAPLASSSGLAGNLRGRGPAANLSQRGRPGGQKCGCGGQSLMGGPNRGHSSSECSNRGDPRRGRKLTRFKPPKRTALQVDQPQLGCA